MTTHTTRRRLLSTLGASVGGLTAASGIVTANTDVERVVDFDPAAGELPENVTTTPFGTKFVSFPNLGEIRAVGRDGSVHEFATFDIGEGSGPVGLHALPWGTVYACLATGNADGSDEHGIWKASPRGEPELVAAMDPGTFPNDLIDFGRSLLVTDSIGGAVLRVRDGDVEPWVEDPLLAGDGSLDIGFPLGANGIVRGKRAVYVANTEKGHVVRIPVERDGSAGTPEVFVEDERLVSADGMAIDASGALYTAMNRRDTVVRIDRGKDIETLATADDSLDGPSDVTFGTSPHERKTVFITNFALVTQEDPALLELDVGRPGQPGPRWHRG